MVEINKIDELAKEKGIKASFICSSIGKGESFLRQVRAGRCGIAECDLEIIADILGTTTDYLHGKTDKKEKPGKIAGLSENEIELLNLFRLLSAQEQDLFLKMFRAKQE